MSDSDEPESNIKLLAKGEYTREISIFTVSLAVVIGTLMRISMGTLDRLQKFDPFEHYRLSQYWYENWTYMTHDFQLLPRAGGELSSVGYPPLTHATPASITQLLNWLGIEASVMDVVILGPVLFTALIPVVYWYLGKELYDERVGIVAAALTIVFPHLIEVGRAGAYDTNPHIALFLPLILLLLVKSLRHDSITGRVHWGLGAGLTMGIFGLFWAGYTMMFAFTAFSIIAYVVLGTWLNKVDEKDTYSFLGILIAYPVLLFWHSPSRLEGVALLIPLIFLPYISANLPEWSEKLKLAENGYKFRNLVTTAVGAIVVIGAVLTYQGVIPISVPGLGLVAEEYLYGTIAELQPTFGAGFERGAVPLMQHFGHWGSLILPVFLLPLALISYKLWKNFEAARVFELVFVSLSFFMMFLAARFLPLYLYFVVPVVAAEIIYGLDLIGMKKLKEKIIKPYGKVSRWDVAKVSIAVLLVVSISFTSMPLADGFEVQQHPSPIYMEDNGAWISTFEYMEGSDDFSHDTHVLTWWDYGFPMKALADVGAVTDNTQANAEFAADFYMQDDPGEAYRMLTEEAREERGEEVDYVVVNKGLGMLIPDTMYGGKTGAVATVAQESPENYVEDWPEDQDMISQQIPWSVYWDQGMEFPNVPEPLAQTTYYELAYPAGVMPGIMEEEPEVGDVLHDHYKVVHMSEESGPFGGSAIIVYELVDSYELTVNIEGEGTVEVDGEPVEDGWTGTYGETSQVELNATADEGWCFEEWIGTEETGEIITVDMDENRDITAVFEEEID